MTLTPARSLSALTAALVAAVALSGCGGSSGGSDAAPAAAGGSSSAAPGSDAATSDAPADAETGQAPDPCSLLTAAEIGTALGYEVSPGAENPPDVATEKTGLRGCTWNVPSEPGKTFFLQVTTDAAIPDGATTASALYEQSVSIAEGLTPSSGIGDKSAFAESGGFVLAGDTFLSTLLSFGKEGSAQIVQTLTAAAVARLP